MIYLASPYTHPDPDVRAKRYLAVCREVARLVRDGHVVFSPIAHSHGVCVHGGLPLDWSFWWPIDTEFLRRCDELWILMLDGWQESHGVQAEMEIARRMGKEIRMVAPQTEVET